MAMYQLHGKHAIVTGAESGIHLVLAKSLLESGCSVMIADLKLRPEAEELLAQYTATLEKDKITVKFQKTGLSDWAQITTLWENNTDNLSSDRPRRQRCGFLRTAVQHILECVRCFAPGRGSSRPEARNLPHLRREHHGPIRLAQIAVDYWLQHRDIEGSLFWVASVGGYVHSIQTPFYLASKAAVVSMVKSLAGLKKSLGIRNAAICPGVVNTPIFHPGYCRDRVRPDDFTLTPEQCAAFMLRIITEPQFGDGNLVEIILVGTGDNPFVSVREVPVEALYPTVGPVGEDNHLLEEEAHLVKHVQEYGMREPYVPPSTRNQVGSMASLS